MFETLKSAKGSARSPVSGLDFLWLEITEKCNLRCQHCYVSSSPSLPLTGKMQLVDWCRLMDDASSRGCHELQFIGGEPTIHPDLKRLIRHATGTGFDFCEVYTNAGVLRKDLLDTIEEHGVQVAFSFYCSDPEIHDAITGRRGSHQRTVAGVQELLDRGIPHRASVIVMEENASYTEETEEFLKELGVASVSFDRVRGIGRGERYVPEASPMSELCGACWKGRLCVDPDGDAYPCVFSRFVPVGNFFTDGLGGIIDGEYLRAFRSRLHAEQERDADEAELCKPHGTCKPTPFEKECQPSHGTCKPTPLEKECQPSHGTCKPIPFERECKPGGTCKPNRVQPEAGGLPKVLIWAAVVAGAVLIAWLAGLLGPIADWLRGLFGGG